MTNPSILWIAIALAALSAGLAAVLLLRRKPKSQPPADTLFSKLDDRSPEGNTPLDPIAEADVYLAYGNRQEAVSVLRKAAQEYPERTDILEKIREIRAAIKTKAGGE
jgi:pilus assembly protein FimV